MKSFTELVGYTAEFMKFLKLTLVSHLKTFCHCKLSCSSLNINNTERAYSNFTSFTMCKS